MNLLHESLQRRLHRDEDLVEFADHVFFDRPLSAEFGQLAYPQEPNGFRWTAPQ